MYAKIYIYLLETLAQYERVESSSLHILIACDALGIEHRWTPCDSVLGDGWKFHDYVTAFGESEMSTDWRLTDRDAMGAVRAQVHELWQHEFPRFLFTTPFLR